MGTKGFHAIRNHQKCLSQLFLVHLHTYVMGLRPLEIVELLQSGDQLWTSESDVYGRQIVTFPQSVCKKEVISEDSDGLTTKADPRAVGVNLFY